MVSLPPYTPLKLTPEIAALVNNALADNCPMLFICVDEAAKPLMSFRGTLQAYSDDQLALWIRNKEGGSLHAIAGNPNVACAYRSSATNALMQFFGRARVVQEESIRTRIFENSPAREQAADPERKGTAVLIDLDRVEGILGYGPSGPVGFTRMARGA